MAQTNYTPIQLYRSATPAAAPLAANLAEGELAINYTDGRLYFEDNGGTVRIIGATMTAAVATFLGVPSSANLAAAVTDETGSGALVFGTSPTLADPTTTGQVRSVLGSAGAPSYTFTGDLNTGVWSANPDELDFSTAGVNRLSLSTTAFTSAVPFVTSLGAAGTPSYTFNGDLNTGLWSPGADTVAISTAGAERMQIDSLGAVGIGGAPTGGRLLELISANPIESTVRSTGATSYSAHRYLNDQNSSSRALFVAYLGSGASGPVFTGSPSSESAAIGTTGAYPISIATSNTERIRISADGDTVISGFGLTTLYTLRVRGNFLSEGVLSVENQNTSTTQQTGAALRLASSGSGADVFLTFTDNTVWNSRIGVAGVAGASEMYFAIDGDATPQKRLALTADGRFYGTALHNNAGAVTGTTNQYIASGTYTPTSTPVAGVTTVTSSAHQWTRVGNVVTVSGYASVLVTGGAAPLFRQTLPIASNFASGFQCVGTAFCSFAPNGLAGYVIGDNVNDQAGVSLIGTPTAGTYDFFYQFTYVVL